MTTRLRDLQQMVRKLLFTYPVIKSIEFHPDGTVSKLEFFEPPLSPAMRTTIIRHHWHRGRLQESMAMPRRALRYGLSSG
jgi:hypothetical protein